VHYICEEGSKLSLLYLVGTGGAKSRIRIGSCDESVVCVESLALAGATSSARKAIEEILRNYSPHVSTSATWRSSARTGSALAAIAAISRGGAAVSPLTTTQSAGTATVLGVNNVNAHAHH